MNYRPNDTVISAFSPVARRELKTAGEDGFRDIAQLYGQRFHKVDIPGVKAN